MDCQKLNEAFDACNLLIDYLLCEQPSSPDTARRLDDLNALRSEILETSPTSGEFVEEISRG